MALILIRRTATVATKFLTVQSRQIQTSHQLGKQWRLGKLNHVAVACPDIDKSACFYRDVLHAKVSQKEDLPCHGVSVVFVDVGDTKIELLQPLGDKSPIQNFLDKNPCGGMHHICLEVSDINAAMAELKCKNVRTLEDKPAMGAHGKPVVFLHPKDCCGVLVELEEVSSC